jgi:hypothetical protein
MSQSFWGSKKFWLTLIATSLAFSIILNWLDGLAGHKIVFRILREPSLKIGLVLALWFILFFGWSWLKIEIKKQFSRSEPSWIVFVYYGFFFSPFVGEILKALLWKPLIYFDLSVLVWPVLGLLLYALTYEWLGSESFEFSVEQFAPGSVGIENDELDFTLSAKLAADRINNLTEAVNVVGLFGGMGSGKSSFNRMIVENLNAETNLYTYISLTETNEASDFSRLFAERWANTIEKRYTKLFPFQHSTKSLLRDILRESKNGGWVSHLLSLIPNFGIFSTPLRVHDRYFKPQSDFVMEDVASYFNFVTNFHEKKWIIVIDEIERSKLSELYRVIEIIERTKYLGRRGLPISLVFILNISRRDLQARLSDQKGNENTILIRDFLFDNPKNITLSLFVPPLPIEKLIFFIAKPIEKLFKEFNFGEHEHQELLAASTKNFVPDAGKDTMGLKSLKEFPNDHHQAYSHLFTKYLLEEDLRSIFRIIDQARFLISGFVYVDTGKINTESIRFTDLLALAYIQVKYPALIEYFGRTVGRYASYERPFHVKPPEVALVNSLMLGERLDHRFANQAIEKGHRNGNELKPEDRLYAHISSLVGTGDKSILLDLVALVSHFYLDGYRINDWSEDKDKFLDYYYTTSNPRNLRDVLRSFTGDKTQNDIDFSNYRQNQTNPDWPLEIEEVTELISYSHFYRNRISERSSYAHLVIAQAVYKALIGKKIPLDPNASFASSTLMVQATLEFVFNIMDGVLLSNKKEDHVKAAQMLIDSLESKELNLESKIKIVRAFLHERDGDVHHQLARAFEKMTQSLESTEPLKKSIRDLVEDLRTRYQDRDQNIYDQEESPIFVLYQSWSGDPEDRKDLERMEDIAQKGLIDHPQAIERYWGQYKFDPKWKDIDDAMDSVRSRDIDELINGTNPTVPLKTKILAIITEESTVNESLKQKARFWSDENVPERKIVQDSETLVAVLAKHPFLNPPSE